MKRDRAEVAIVGGGPAGAVTAALLAGQGHEVVLLERAPAWRWRACGVFSAPAGVAALRRIGLAEAAIAALARPVAAMRVESRLGTSFRLTYDGTGGLVDSAVGFDREALDTLLLDVAQRAGAQLVRGARVEAVMLDDPVPRLVLQGEGAGQGRVEASVVVGADGLRSIVGRSAGAAARAPYPDRWALTFHARGDEAERDARMVLLEDGYVGLAPVPGGRVNVGMVLGRRWSGRLREAGAAAVARAVLKGVAGVRSAPDPLPVLDRVAGVRPVSAAVRRRAGERWLLVGDAAGFLDPFTGEGIHRALVSAELAAGMIHEVLSGRPGARLAEYDGAMRARFATKDLVSRVVQAFIGRPALFEYAARRLAARAGIRDTMGRVIGDLEPASAALDPRFLAALLAP